MRHLLATMGGNDIAAACGVHESTVSRWRNGLTVPSDPATLARLARVDLGLLVYGPTERLRAALDAVAP
jgi:transcriptional regulator with XRE-family HTH domain